MIIGQYNALSWIQMWVEKGFPHFVVFIAPKGCGKRTLAKYIAEKLNASYAECGIKVDEIREVIDTAYKVRDQVVFCIADADTMRAEAKNAMLKVTEEPPENAYFVLTVRDDSTLLDTIKSRSVQLILEPYIPAQLEDYCELKGWNDPATKEMCSMVSNPYELEKLREYGKEFIDYVELVLDNIADVEPSNAFKSSSKLALKADSEDGYDLGVFFSVFIYFCEKRLEDNPLRYAQGMYVTEPFLSRVNRLGVNKQQLYDSWVFGIREVWL